MYSMYEIGLTNTCEAISEYKEACEKQMEQETANLFNDEKFIVIKGLDFHKTINEGISQELGDYDVIAINKDEKVIWNLESKFIHKVGSIYEYANQQKVFFVQGKYDEKFQRRIDFLEKNYKILLEYNKIPFEEYSIRNDMVTNKVLEAEIKKIKFEIITFKELRDLIKKKD